MHNMPWTYDSDKDAVLSASGYPVIWYDDNVTTHHKMYIVALTEVVVATQAMLATEYFPDYCAAVNNTKRKLAALEKLQ